MRKIIKGIKKHYTKKYLLKKVNKGETEKQISNETYRKTGIQTNSTTSIILNVNK